MYVDMIKFKFAFMRPLLAFFASVMIFVSGCRHDVPQPDNPDGTEIIHTESCHPDTVYFQQDILPMLVAACGTSGCHDAASAEDGIVIESYASLLFGEEDDLVVPGDPSDSELYEVITENDPDKIMPPPPANPFSAAQIDLIANWIAQGAINNSCNACDTALFTFNAVILPMMEANCTSCHGGSTPDANLDLTNYNGVASAASYMNLMERISHAAGFDPMPPSGDGLSDCQVQQVQNWINAGMPND